MFTDRKVFVFCWFVYDREFAGFLDFSSRTFLFLLKNDCTSSNKSDKYINVKSKGEFLKLLSIQKRVFWNGFCAWQIDCKNVLRTQTSNKVKSIRTADIFSFIEFENRNIFFPQNPLVVNIIKQLFHSISSYMANSRLGYASSAMSSCTTRFRGIIVKCLAWWVSFFSLFPSW